MSANAMRISLPSEVETLFTRTFAQPRGRLFRAWTDDAILARWFTPDAFTTPVCTLNARPGGPLRIVQRSPTGVDYPLTGEVREVSPPSRLVLALRMDEHPESFRALLNRYRGLRADAPAPRTVATVTFDEADAGTHLGIHIRYDTPTDRDAFLRLESPVRWAQCLEKLDALGDR